MENNIDTYGFYKRSNDAFVRWNNNDPATLRHITAMKHEVQYMASDTISVEIDSVAPITNCEIGDYILHGGEKFVLNQSPAFAKIAERQLHYTYTFDSVKYELIKSMFFLPTEQIVTADFTGTMFQFLKMIVQNACRVFGAGSWQLPLDSNGNWAGTATLPDEAKTLSYDGQNCLYVLQNICEEWGVDSNPFEYIITEDINTHVKTIDIIERNKTASTDVIDNNGHPFMYGQNNGLYRIERVASNSENLITKLFVFGSRENLPEHYFATRLGLNKARNGGTVGDQKLSYLDTYTEGGQIIRPSDYYGLREGQINFDDIKPRATWYVGNVSSITHGSDIGAEFWISIRQATGDPVMFNLNEKWQTALSDTDPDYTTWLKFRNIANVTAITLNTYNSEVAGTYKYFANGETASINFTSGDCAGMTFNIKALSNGVDYNHALKRLTLLPNDEQNVYNADTGQTDQHYYTPHSGIKPKIGDSFVFLGIYLPWSYVQTAEAELLRRGQERYREVCQPQAAYNIEIANDFVLQTYGVHDADKFVCGKYLHIVDTALNLDKKIRLTQYSRDLIKGYHYDLTISDFMPRRQTADNNNVVAADAVHDALIASYESSAIIDLDLNMEFTTAGNFDKLQFYCIDPQFNRGVLTDNIRNRQWLIDNSDITLDRDTEYDIYLILNKTTTSATVSVRESFLTPLTTDKAVVVEKNRNLVVLAGHISRITYSSTLATQPYRTVEMWLGRALNQARKFIGTEIVSASQNLKISLGNFAGTTLESVSFSSAENKSSFSFNDDGFTMQRPQTVSEGEAARIACYRGDFHPAKYNDGDIVRVALPDGNYTTYRCIADETDQQEEITPESPNWVALAPTNVGGGGTTTLIAIENHTLVATGTPVSISGHSLIIAQ